MKMEERIVIARDIEDLRVTEAAPGDVADAAPAAG
jgi:hypothetical protein